MYRTHQYRSAYLEHQLRFGFDIQKVSIDILRRKAFHQFHIPSPKIIRIVSSPNCIIKKKNANTNQNCGKNLPFDRSKLKYGTVYNIQMNTLLIGH